MMMKTLIHGLAGVLATTAAHAGVVNVATSDELVAAIAAAQPGDEIVLADGTYTLGDVSCSTAGTESAPIVVRAANRLAADLQLTGSEGFKVSAPHWHFEGLDITGACASDPVCEHAFHVTGRADGFVLRHSRVVDFNAQLKVNASKIGDVYEIPDRGLVEYSEIGDTRGRATSNPTTKLNIDTGEGWVVRGNYIHDAYKMEGDGISYAAFMKSGGTGGVFERNLVLCARTTTGGTRIGLSFGGGGTGAQFCAPAFDPNVPCAVEHTGGVMRNNIIANCSDVGIYLNRSKDTRLLYNTLVETSGIDFRFETTTGEADGNLTSGMIRERNGGSVTLGTNLTGLTLAQFMAAYRAPLVGDFTVTGDLAAWLGAGPMRADVVDDYCAQTRPGGPFTLGAVEHSVGTCDTTMPPVAETPGGGPDGGVGGPDGGGDGGDDEPGGEGGGCCSGARGGASSLVGTLVVGALLVRGRRRYPTTPSRLP